MGQIDDWLHNTNDPPIDPRLFENIDDIDFSQWTTGDLDPNLDTGDGNATDNAKAEWQKPEQPHQQDTSTTPGNHTPGFAPPSGQHQQAVASTPTTQDAHLTQWHQISTSDLNYGLQQYHVTPDPRDLTHQDPHHHYPDPPTASAHYTNPRNPASQYLSGPYPPEATTQNMSGGGWQQQQNPYYVGQQNMFVPQQTDFTFSLDGEFGTPLFPEAENNSTPLFPDPTPEPDPEPPRGRQNRTKGSSSGDGGKENPTCIDCGKKYRTSKSPGRCTRCGQKFERRVAQPFMYTLDPSVPDFPTARRMIFSPIEGRHVYQDDVLRYAQDPNAENHFVQRLLDAINVVQTPEAGWDTWSVRQQKTFNEKAKMEENTYNNPLVTARLRALYREILNYHLGGDAVYAVGGDNGGYADDRTLRFSQRMTVICDVLRKNKRVVMDVVEGRGVQGFVSNPRKYHERKASNNNCNVEKKRIMEKGKEIEAEMGSVVTTGTRKGKRGREDDGEGGTAKRAREVYSPEWLDGYERL